jgi:sugar phosphate isomerase/epimerase
MQFAFMSFSCPDLGLKEMIDLAASLGYDAIELRAQDEQAHGAELDSAPQRRDAIRAAFAASPIELCCLAVSCSYADPASREQHIVDTHSAIDLAADIGCDRIRVFGGGIGAGIDRATAIVQVADSLSSIGEHAAARGVTICVETHDAWRDPNHMVAVMRQCDHPHIAINWDIMHPIMAASATIEQSFEIMQPWIRHVHVHDGRQDGNGSLEFLPIGDGVVDHGAALKCLKAAGYDGAVSGEWIGWEPYDVHLPRELASLKALEA